MYPSKPNANAAPSNSDSETSKFVAPSSAPGEKHGPPTDLAYQSSNPSAPLLPSGPYNQPPPNMEPPPYSSVVAQDSSNWKNTPGSSPYPMGPSPAPGPTNQAPYPTHGPPAQAPYPTGPGSAPEFANNAPYPTGPGLGSGITSQPPYSTGPGYTPGPASQAPYPVAPMPMPAPVDTDRRIGFTAPVTTEPKSAMPGYPYGGYGPGPTGMQTGPYPVNGNQPGLIYPQTTGENNQYVHTSQYVPNQYGQQQPQQPNTIYVVQKEPQQQSSTDDDCAFLACCLASCYCLCECIKLCASSDS